MRSLLQNKHTLGLQEKSPSLIEVAGNVKFDHFIRVGWSFCLCLLYRAINYDSNLCETREYDQYHLVAQILRTLNIALF